VRGYKGGAEINIAIERGEVHGRSTTWETWPGSHPDWLRDKKLVHLVQLGPRKLPRSVTMSRFFATWSPRAKSGRSWISLA